MELRYGFWWHGGAGLGDYLADGSQLYQTTSSSPYVIALASDSAAALISPLPHTVIVQLNGIPLTLDRYEMLVTTPPLDADVLDSSALGVALPRAQVLGYEVLSRWMYILP